MRSVYEIRGAYTYVLSDMLCILVTEVKETTRGEGRGGKEQITLFVDGSYVNPGLEQSSDRRMYLAGAFFFSVIN